MKEAFQKYRKLVKWFWRLTIIGILFVVLLIFLISVGAIGYMPDVEELEKPKTYLATQVLSSDQEILGLYFNENRTVAELDNLSPHLLNALVATEDYRYYDHSGIDGWSLLRVIVKTGLMGRRNSGGGSTISQQLAKNLLKTRELNESMLVTKLKEWVISVRLEKRYTKDEIITMYLNTVEYGSNAYGINAASKTYFNKKPKDLKIEEAAVLIGLLKATTAYNPKRNPNDSKGRRNTVFSQMNKYGYVSDNELDSLKDLPLVLDYERINYNTGLAPYFRAYLKRIMNAEEPDDDDYATEEDYEEAEERWENDPLYGWCNKNEKPDGSKYDLNTDGLKIYTTINSRMQKYAEEAVEQHLGKELQAKFNETNKNNKNAPYSGKLSKAKVDEIIMSNIKRSIRYANLKRQNVSHDSIMKVFNTPIKLTLFSWKGDIEKVMSPMDSIKYMKQFLHTGFFSIEPQTGYVRAYVGGIDHKQFEYDHVKIGKRQVGSTFKPLIYATYMSMDQTNGPCKKIHNTNHYFQLPTGKKWAPAFSKHKEYDGKMISLKTGLANSMNQASAWVLKQINGPEKVIKLARQMGIKSHIDPYPSICVGSPDISLYEMVAAYGVFANKGVYNEPLYVTRIEDRYGNIISSFSSRKVQEAISEDVAYIMLHMMKAVVTEGTSTRIGWKYGLKNEIAGKTGTTNDNSDGWFIGITPELVSGAWVGGDERTIRFSSTSLGQGANMALPIWALYMQKVYRDSKLKVSKGPFEKPEYLSVELDCSKSNDEGGKFEF